MYTNLDLIQNDDEKEKLQQNNLANIDRLKTRINMLCREIELKKDENDYLKSQNDDLSTENQKLKNIMLVTNKTIGAITSGADPLHREKNFQNVDDKNRLEEKIRSLEEEIEMYKLRLTMSQTTMEASTSDNTALNDKNNNIEKAEDVLQEEQVKMEDLPVQGPIPKEPDEKLFNLRDRKSRIWSFFPRLTRALIKWTIWPTETILLILMHHLWSHLQVHFSLLHIFIQVFLMSWF